MASFLLPDTFIYLAKNYRITGNSIEEVCDHNAAVARHMNQDFVSSLVSSLCSTVPRDFSAFIPLLAFSVLAPAEAYFGPLLAKLQATAATTSRPKEKVHQAFNQIPTR